MRFEFNDSSTTGILSNKYKAIHFSTLNNKFSHWKILLDYSFLILLTNNFKNEEKSLCIQALQKDIPILCFTAGTLPLNGVYNVPNKNSSTEFLFFWIYFLLNIIKK